MLNQPKRKHLFIAGFVGSNESGLNRFFQESSGVFLVKRVEVPSFDFDVETLDQYNKKRVVQKRINYNPISITFHDDVNNSIYRVASTYVRYYYGDSYNVDENDWTLDTVNYLRKQGLWGLMPKTQKYFFRSVWIAWVNSGRVTYMSFQNPLINNISYDSLDYADSNPLELTFTLSYEGVIFREINASVLGQSDSEVVQNVQRLFFETDFVGQPFAGPTGVRSIAGAGDRGFGLGEIFNTASTFFGKYNGNPSVEDALQDFVVRPVLGSVSGGLNSWGNYNFGGIGSARGSEGLFGGVGQTLSAPLQFVNNGSRTVNTITGAASDAYDWGKSQLTTNSGTQTTTSNFGISSSSDGPVNNRFLNSTRNDN